jgi:PII-like signaling protein
MLNAGKALKVSIYLSQGATHRGAPVYSSILDFLYFRGVSGATVLKGVAGFGAEHRIHSESTVEISDHLPIKIEFIETTEKVNELMGKLEELTGSGMIEVQETRIAKPARVSKKPKVAPIADHVKIEGKAKMMRVYIGESDQWQQQPLHLALVRRCVPMTWRVSPYIAASLVMALIGVSTKTRRLACRVMPRSC